MRTRTFVPCAAAVTAIGLGLAVPALASPEGRAVTGAPGATAPPNGGTGVPAMKSTGFAGYKIHSKFASDTNVTTTIVVPHVKCTKANRAIAPSVGLYEDSNSNLSSAGLFVGCINGKARYFPVLTVNKHQSKLTNTAAHPGDMVVLEVAANSVETTVEVFDETHAFDKSKTGAPFSSFVANPFVGDMKWSTSKGAEGVPNFGTISFSTATSNGNPIGSLTPLERFNRYNKTRTTLQIKAGNLGTDEMSFKTIFKHS